MEAAMKRHIVAVLLLTLAACSRTESDRSSGTLVDEQAPVAGLRWSHPASWTKQHDLPMRVATYLIPAADGDAESGECGVFYFGSDQGGGVDMNIQRWGSQFEGATQAEKTAMEVNGVPVTIARIEGTYLVPAGPMMESQGKKEGYKLLAAIVEGPEGMVFFKCTGPEKTIDGAQEEFLAMVNSLRKE
jgi:hypothetical protein